MKITIRQGVFETNSSSMHAIAIASQSEMDDWKAGKIKLLGTWDEGEFISSELADAKEHWQTPIWTYEEFIHQNDDGSGYDMCDDIENFPPPGTIIEENGEYILHYQS